MSDTLKEYVHDFPVLEVYPRIYYFYRRFRDLLTRYKRVTASLPKCFHEDVLMSGLDRLKYDLDSGVRIHVIGQHDIDDSDLVFSSPTSRSQKETTEKAEPKIALVIWHINLEKMDAKELQDIIASFKAVGAYTERLGLNNDVIIKCDISKCYSKDRIVEFRNAMLAALNDDPSDFHVQPSNILIEYDHSDLNTTISDTLEKVLGGGFSQMHSHLNVFESVTGESGLENTNILEVDTVVNPLKEFLRHARNNIEIDLTEDTEKKICGEILQCLLRSLCRVIRCSLVNPLAKKFGLKAWICNGLLNEIQFEEAMKESIAKNTLHHLRKLAMSTYKARSEGIKFTRKCYSFDFICFLLQSDMKPVVDKVEKKFLSMQRLTMVIRRMAFETQGYLKKMIIDSTEETVLQQPKLPKELRHALLSLPGVYGLGTIYGQLEIHVDKDIVKNSPETSPGTDEVRVKSNDVNDGTYNLDSGDTINYGVQSYKQNMHLPRLKSVIATQLKKTPYNGQYTVKYIQKKPEEMYNIYEPGDKLLRRGKGAFAFGTLGAFIFTKDGILHGLTCGHVVGENKQIFIDKGGPAPFSCCPRIVKTGTGELKYIDIAALEVLPTLQKECKRSLEKSFGRVTTAKMSDDHPESLSGNIVYKHGAVTGETKGFIVSYDYVYKGFDEEAIDYLVMIDTVPDVPDGPAEDFGPINNQNDTRPSQMFDQNRNDQNMEVVQNVPCHSAEDLSPINTLITVRPSQPLKSNTVLQDVPNDVTDDISPMATQNYDTNALQSFEKDGNNIDMDTDETPFHETPGDETCYNEHVYKDEKNIGIMCSNSDTYGTFPLESGCSISKKIRLDDTQSSLDSQWLEVCGSNNDCGDLLVYIRDVQSVSSDVDEQQTPDGVFAKSGDSGSIVCTPDIARNSLNYLAVSMLSAGNFEIEGNEGLKCLSFKLNVGLEKLKQKYALDF